MEMDTREQAQSLVVALVVGGKSTQNKGRKSRITRPSICSV
jgi:hypothetical protein